MTTPTIVLLITTFVSAPLMTAVVSWIRDRKKDRASEDQITVATMKEVITELRNEVTRLHGYIKNLEAEIEDLRSKFKK